MTRSELVARCSVSDHTNITGCSLHTSTTGTGTDTTTRTVLILHYWVETSDGRENTVKELRPHLHGTELTPKVCPGRRLRGRLRPPGKGPRPGVTLANRRQLLEVGRRGGRGGGRDRVVGLCARRQPAFHSRRREGSGVGRHWSVVVAGAEFAP